MTKRETVSLLIKLLGFYFIIQFFPTLSFILQVMGNYGEYNPAGDAPTTFRLLAVAPALWIGVGMVILRLSDSIARILVLEDKEGSGSSGLNFRDAQVLGFNLMGLFFIANSLHEIIGVIVDLQSMRTLGYEKLELLSMGNLLWGDLFAFLTQLAVGLVLFISPKGVANLWKRLQPMRDDGTSYNI